ncbi:MAG: ABC transporter ATP-binding protein [Clostridiales bacterium]|nr:ABC transporter ATP-binding protein [Clostridiales bacterium]
MAMLELMDVCYGYGIKRDKKNVLNHISCGFEQGKLYAVIGKSGSGKSTLLSLLTGLDLPQSGQILFEGTPTDKMDLNEYRRKCVAVVYQDFSLFPLLTALENIMYPMQLCNVGKEKARRDALALSRLVSLPESMLDRYPGRMSGGEQQRVAIARALSMDRRLILGDEPTGNLDSENSSAFIPLMQKLAHEENKCIIIATHDISVMESADEVYKIVDGQLSLYRNREEQR